MYLLKFKGLIEASNLKQYMVPEKLLSFFSYSICFIFFDKKVFPVHYRETKITM